MTKKVIKLGGIKRPETKPIVSAVVRWALGVSVLPNLKKKNCNKKDVVWAMSKLACKIYKNKPFNIPKWEPTYPMALLPVNQK